MQMRLLQLILLLVACSVCMGLKCGPGQLEHYGHDGHRRCCQNVTCPVGEKPVICPEEGTSASCRPCENGSFMDVETPSQMMDLCRQKQQCPLGYGLIVKDEGGTTSDRLCGCDLERSYYDPKQGQCTGHYCPERCVQKECDAGRESTEKGKCTHCELGFYKEMSGFNRCVEQKHCIALGFEVLIHGNTTHDNVCSNITVSGGNFTTTVTPAPVGAPHVSPTIMDVRDDEDAVSSIVTILVITFLVVLVTGVVFGLVIQVLRKRKKHEKKVVFSFPTPLLTGNPAGAAAGELFEKDHGLPCMTRRPSGCSITVNGPGPLEGVDLANTPLAPLLLDFHSANNETTRKEFNSLPNSHPGDSGIFGNLTTETSMLEEDSPGDGITFDTIDSMRSPQQQTQPKTIEGAPNSRDNVEPDSAEESITQGYTYIQKKVIINIRGKDHKIIIGDQAHVVMDELKGSMENIASVDSGIGPEVVEMPEE